MSFIIAVLTVFMVLDCLILILLVLMQLPKKEAGAGLAFGAGATDALFGAGSGNFLTKATKYTAIVFFVLAATLSTLQNSVAKRPDSKFRREVEEKQKAQQAQIQRAQSAPAQAASPAAVTNAEVMPAVSFGSNSMILLPPSATAPSNAAPQK